MRLTRITKLRGHRVFRDFRWPGDLHSFGQFNLIYGWNGSGKTTLSSLLSHVEKRTVLTEGEIELEFENTIKVTGTELPGTPLPNVRVFNREFVNATLQSTGGIKPIYFLGEDNIEKQAQIEQLGLALADAQTEVVAARTAKATAQSRLDSFQIDRAKLIKDLLISSNSQAYNNYDKRQFGRAIQSLDAQSAAAALLDDKQKARLRRQKDGLPKQDVSMLAAPAVDLDACTAEVEAIENRSVVAQTLDELTSDASLAAWVQDGIALHSGEHATDTCRFCRQPFAAERRLALESHFNDAFASFQKELDALLTKLEGAKESVGSLALPDASRFHETLSSSVSDASAKVTLAQFETEAALDALIARIEAKQKFPFAPTAKAAPTTPAPTSLADAILALNTISQEHNKISAEFKLTVDRACKELEASYVAESYEAFVQLSEAVTAAKLAVESAEAKPSGIKTQIDELERTILEHRRPADELTEDLKEYLGRDEFRFELSGTGYALMRGEQPIANLSEGERTAIALLYFLKSLQDRKFNIARGIVVIDDPVSSLDANAMYSAFGYIKARTKLCGQVIVLTHSFPFFRLVKSWIHHLPGQRKKPVELRPGRLFMLRTHRHADGHRTAELCHLDRLLEEHDSEYQYLFKRVFDEANRSEVDSLEQHYGLPNVARRLIEAFLAFRFPHIHGDRRLSQCFSDASFDEARKTRILRFINTYSHGGAITDPEHDLASLAEAQPVLLDVLEMMKSVDKDHYDGLMKLIADVDVEGDES